MSQRWLTPPFTAFLLLVHPLLSLVRPDWQLRDPGIGWHLATGRYILESHSIPTHDVFSFTAALPWVNCYWLFDVVGALLERAGGLPLYATACMLVYAFVPVLLYRRMLRIGASIIPALVLTLLAYLVLTSHAAARPHVITYLFFSFFLERLDDVQHGRQAPHSLWILAPLVMLWCNLHGGFVAGLVLVGIFAAVAAVRALLTHDVEQTRLAVTFARLLGVLFLATLVNPNGFGLHRDIVHFLGMSTVRYFDEFQSPNFLVPGVPVRLFEVLVLGTLVVVAVARQRLTWVELALLAFFLHQALQSVRHINLFAIVAAPIVAREISVLLAAARPAFAERWRHAAEAQMRLRSERLYLPALTGLFLVLATAGVSRFPRSFDDLQLTRGAADFIAGHRDRFARPFNTDNLGGALIHRFSPDVPVFFDDRIFVYGDPFVSDDYLTVAFARRDWNAVLEKYRVDSAVVAADTPIATVLRGAPGWQLAYEDATNVIFLRGAADGPKPERSGES